VVGTRLRIGLLFLAPLGAVTLVLMLALPQRMNAAARQSADQRARAITSVLGNAAAAALEREEPDHAAEILATVSGDREVVGAVLRRHDGTELARFPTSGPLHPALGHRGAASAGSRDLVVGTEVVARGGTRGELVLVFSREALLRQERENQLVVGLLAAVTLAVGIVFSAVTTWFLLRRQRAEKELARSERNLRALIEASPDAMIVHRGGQPIFVNPAAHRLLGPGLEGAREHGLLTDAAREPQELQIASRDGRRVMVETRPLALYDEAPAHVSIARDMSDKGRLEAQLLLADRMASVGTLAAGVAHEINNPLAYVLANLEYVTHELGSLAGLDPDLHAALVESRSGAERVRDIVRDLKTFSRADDESTLPVDLHASLDVAIQMTATAIRHRGGVLKRYGDLPLVTGNESRFGQVFVNLLVNAAHALPAAGGIIEIATRTDAEGRAVITIADNGSGIPPEVVGRIFDPFFTTKPVGEGTGLGLSICHNIVAAAKGSLQVRSTLGQGTTFTIVLPRAEIAEDESTVPAVRPPAPRDARILVVDDEPLVLSAVQRTLGRQLDVVTTTSPRAALARLVAGEQFDVILCDLMMPEMSGYQLHAELLRVESPQLERIVFLTGTVTPDSRDFLARAGRPHVDKPFDPEELRQLISQMVAGTA
jgi:two-component system, cell cycle sensor histidine kinase and response regulator CckA